MKWFALLKQIEKHTHTEREREREREEATKRIASRLQLVIAGAMCIETNMWIMIEK